MKSYIIVDNDGNKWEIEAKGINVINGNLYAFDDENNTTHCVVDRFWSSFYEKDKAGKFIPNE